LVPRQCRPFIGVQFVCSAALVLFATATEPKAWEALIDPLGDLWLPRFLANQLGETSAHVHWGLHGWQPLLVLAFATLAALVALALITRPQRWAARAALALTLLLLALTLAFGLPLDTRAARMSNTLPAAVYAAPRPQSSSDDFVAAGP
jgi:hypothetical protein